MPQTPYLVQYLALGYWNTSTSKQRWNRQNNPPLDALIDYVQRGENNPYDRRYRIVHKDDHNLIYWGPWSQKMEDNGNYTETRGDTMNIETNLHVKRATIIGKIEAHLKKLKDAHDAAVAKAQAAQQAIIDAFGVLFAAEPSRVVAQLSYNCNTVIELVGRLSEGKVTEEAAVDEVRAWNNAGFPSFVTDKGAEKLLSVLEAAEDETLEVSTDSDLYRYL